jgi:hypothetical protein
VRLREKSRHGERIPSIADLTVSPALHDEGLPAAGASIVVKILHWKPARAGL